MPRRCHGLSGQRRRQPLGAALRAAPRPRASTITRTHRLGARRRGSAPGRRRRARARPRRAVGDQRRVLLPVRAPGFSRTLISVCGNSVDAGEQRRRATGPCGAPPAAPCSALTMPSPVVWRSSASRWPGALAAELPAARAAAPRARSGRRPARARTRGRARRSACSTADVGHQRADHARHRRALRRAGRRPARRAARRRRSRRPAASTICRRSASPSSAMP